MSNPAKVSAQPVVGREAPSPSKIAGKHGSKNHAQSAGQPAPTSSFREIMGKVAKEVGEGQKLMETMTKTGRVQAMDHAEMIAFQAKMYRYTHVLELTGKVVDKSTQSVKYTLQSQQ